MYCNLDGAGQLKSEVKTGSVTQTDLYWYDASGNRTLKNEYLTDEDSNTTSKFIRSTYNEMNQLVTSYDSETQETTEYTYDDYGNLINDGKYEYVYDTYYNRLTSSKNLETNSSRIYDYYIDGLRMRKGYNYYIWLDGNMVYEFSGSESSTYTYGHRLLYSDEVKYVLNAHGDVVALLNDSGVVTKRYDYDAFGNELSLEASDTNPFRYCAEYFDTETGTIYLRARYYSPVTGRFTQLDPIRDGLNWYVYCYNNPILYIDSFGLDAYIFYINEWADEANADKKHIMEFYDLKEDDVILIEVSSSNDFIQGWNSMGIDEEGNEIPIEMVIINVHGTPQGIQYINTSDTEKLENKYVQRTIILSCNAGHQDYENIAGEFSKKTHGNPVLASDGTVYSYSPLIYSFYSSLDDKAFKKHLKGKRKNQGWFIYQTTSNGVESTKVNAKHLSTRNMFDIFSKYNVTIGASPESIRF